MKNKEHSDLVYQYKQAIRKLHYWLCCIECIKERHWSPYDYRDFSSFILEHKSELTERRELVNYYSIKCREIKQKIKQCNINYQRYGKLYENH